MKKFIIVIKLLKNNPSLEFSYVYLFFYIRY